jgi:Dirigent-like protein
MRAVAPAAAVLLAVAAAAAPARAGTFTFTVTSVVLSAKSTDVPPKGTSRGDTVVMRDRLLNAKRQFGRAKSARVGSDHGTMTFTGAHTATFSGVASLPGGTLRISGSVVPVSAGLVIPVTGGTGRFAGAKGYVLVGHGEKTALNVYTLTLRTAPVA